MERALVTGAAGFIGSNVVKELLSQGVKVRAMILPGEPTDNLEGLKIGRTEGDILNPKDVARAMRGVDVVFHLAAIYSTWMLDWSKIYEVNLQGSRNVLWAAMKSKNVKRVVYTSSIAALGTSQGGGLANEETPFDQYAINAHYVLTKYLSQQEALGFAQNGLDLVVVNPAFPFGPGDIAPTPTGEMIKGVLQGKVRFRFDGGINIADVRDVAKGHVLAAQKGKAGQKYILGNKNISMADFIRLVRDAAGMPDVPLPKIPISALKAASYLFKTWADHFSHTHPLMTPSDAEMASRYLYYDVSKARDQLGLECRPIAESIRDSIQWFRERGV
ncbi:NAD-dependent epimerase/dehydratase [Desulfatibacillum aliphaticivorans]|uniref:NAD-dependent epimerase/dehydratase n=1 Tax=Desulfatibacillum aliphaticivorans TaxID=218208 RepID=B8FL23_DESAL|nr:SDR family oxidoreductase [Desulfatibacillum aliphaticivorans]ACL04658.1 NAD-dependent epimerase/dehydratase [Desulfatibacillum aliphaticivorans]